MGSKTNRSVATFSRIHGHQYGGFDTGNLGLTHEQRIWMDLALSHLNGETHEKRERFFSWVPTCSAAEYRQETIGRCTFSRNAREFQVLTLEDSRNLTEQAGGLFRSADVFFWVLKIGATQPF